MGKENNLWNEALSKKLSLDYERKMSFQKVRLFD